MKQKQGIRIAKQKISLVLDNLRSGENVGSIFRTADAVGVSKIYLCGITPIPPHLKIAKAALGAEKYVPYEHHKQMPRLLRKLKGEGLMLITLEQAKNAENIFSYQFPKNKKIVLIVGNEIKGVNKKILSLADKIVEIPMRGRKESLNVAVATGIALYKLTN